MRGRTTRRAWSRCIIACMLVSSLMSFAGRGQAEYGQGLGNIEAGTAEASAKLNDGLSEFHQMQAAMDRRQAEAAQGHLQAAMDRRQAEAAQGHREKALGLLAEAANAFESSKADSHQLNPSPRSDQEKDFIAYFNAHAAEFDVKLPTNQADLIQSCARLVRNFRSRVEKVNVVGPRQNYEAAQALANYSANFQKFLLSVTTVLMITS